MDNLFKLQVYTPMSCFYEADVSMVELTTTEGDIGIYKNHIPMTSIVAPGILRIHEPGGVKEATLMSGFIEVLQNKVTVLAEVCEWPDDIDENRAKEAMERARDRLSSRANIDVVRAELALRRALVRIDVKNR